MPLHPQTIHGIELFNAGEYYEAHEALEDAWREEPGELRNLYKGILQVAVSYFHLLRGNYEGAVEMHRRAQKWLTPWDEITLGIHIGQLRRDFDAAIAELTRLGKENIGQFDPSLLKKVTYEE